MSGNERQTDIFFALAKILLNFVTMNDNTIKEIRYGRK